MRIFTFGCSYTKYKWPTWADILRHSLGDNVVFNYAHSGAGIGQIMYNIQMANSKHNFDPNTDKIVIQWTQFSREDRYIDNKWSAGGGLPNAVFDKDWVKKYHDTDFDYIRSLTIIKTVNAAYRDLIKYQYHWGLHEGISNPKVLTSDMQKYLRDLHIKDFPGINDVYTEYPLYKGIKDWHPSVYGHLEKAKKIAEALNVNISENTKKVFLELDAQNLKGIKSKKIIPFAKFPHLEEGLNQELRDPDQKNLKLWSSEV